MIRGLKIRSGSWFICFAVTEHIEVSMKTFNLVSLGCAKNLVDSELMTGSLLSAGWQMKEDPAEADVLIVNTCGFIQPAVEEAIDEILSLAEYKAEDARRKLVVTGCMVQRYQQKLMEELPEVDLWVGTEGPDRLAMYIEQMIAGAPEVLHLPDRRLMSVEMERALSHPYFSSWLKITEGCDNRCSYCMIPSIRGKLRSREINDLVKEAKLLEEKGVKELNLIAQDLTAYGNDLSTDVNLPILLEKLIDTTSIDWIRLLYLYPNRIDRRLIEIMKGSRRIVPYLDIPFQHVSDAVLKRMNRNYTEKELYSLVDRLRMDIPDLALRTTFLLGFPGETKQDVEAVERFIRDVQFDHLGVFPYANEEGCPSESYSDQIDEEEKLIRVDRILSLQKEISKKKLQRFVGTTQDVLVEGVSAETDLLLQGRTKYQAPEIDGLVYINEGMVNPGEIIEVEITEAHIYDLVGNVKEQKQID